MPLWCTVGISSIVFSLVVHFNTLSPDFVINATLAGMLLALFRVGTGAIWFSIGFHWSWNWSLSFLFGFSYADQESDALLHLSSHDPLWTIGQVSFTGDSLLQIGFLALAVVLVALWLYRKKQVSWSARLNEEGEPLIS
jgi:hypothetical protein